MNIKEGSYCDIGEYPMGTVREAKMTPLEKILAELESATEKFPTWPTDPLHALAVLGEEFGELTQAMLQRIYEPDKTTLENVEKEAIQTAAMAIRLVMSLDRYRYEGCLQHFQQGLR